MIEILVLVWSLGPIAHAEPTPWVEISNAEGITVYRREDPKTGIMAYKGEGVIDAPLGKILTLTRDIHRRTQWADRVKKAEIVEQISPLERIEYLQGSAPWPVKDRDVLVSARIEVDKAKRSIRFFARSVENPARPEDPDYVRAWIHSGNGELMPIDGGKRTRMSAEVQADFRGSIPRWIVNLVQKSAPRKTMKKLMAILKSENIPEDPLAREITPESSGP